MFHPKLLQTLCATFVLLSFWAPHLSAEMSGYPSTYAAISESCRIKTPKKFFGICGSSGPIFFGASANQGVRTDVPGYTMGLGGAGFFLEAELYGIFKVGVALSGFVMRTNEGGDTNTVFRRTKIVSGTPAIYGGINYMGAFFYVTASTGILKYSTSRLVRVANVSASGNFEARQNSYRGRIGYAAPFGSIELTPMATIDNALIYKGTFVETGAGSFNVTQLNGASSASQSAVGLRVAEISEPALFYPEAHFFAISDSNTTGTKLKVISRFVDGLPPIVLQGATPGANGYNVGGSIATSVFQKNVLITAGYEYELRQKGYTGHAVFITLMARF